MQSEFNLFEIRNGSWDTCEKREKIPDGCNQKTIGNEKFLNLIFLLFLWFCSNLYNFCVFEYNFKLPMTVFVLSKWMLTGKTNKP